MAVEVIDICNRALLRVGHNVPISALDEDTEAATVCNVCYEQVRNELLARFPWPFATKHATLALLTYTRSGWTYAYAAPAGLIQAQYIFAGVRPGFSNYQLTSACEPFPGFGPARPISFALEDATDDSGRIILTDQPNAELVYTALVENPLQFPPLFVDALCWSLAIELGMGLAVKAPLADRAAKQFEVSFARATAQAFRESKEDAQPESEFITVRG